MSEDRRLPPWLFLAALAAAVAALAVIVLVRDPVQLDPATPEGVVQSYLEAVNDADYEAAFALLDPASVEGCQATDLRTAHYQEDIVATLGEVEVDNNRAFVTVRFGQYSEPGPFDPGVSDYPEVITLERSGDRWLIVAPVWPYFEWACER